MSPQTNVYLCDKTADHGKGRTCETELPLSARVGWLAIGQPIMVQRESLAVEIRNPELPEWFPARVCMPPDEPGNWYRWYDPFIWYETEIDLSNGGEWATAKRNVAYVGKTSGRDAWVKPMKEGRDD